jgi:hypothetical protein
MAQVKSMMTKKPTMINDEELILFILMTSFRGFVQGPPRTTTDLQETPLPVFPTGVTSILTIK